VPGSKREIVITRWFEAPLERVWKAWTERTRAAQWWGPKGFTARIVAWDLRPGGAWRAALCLPDGVEYAQHGVVEEVTPERIAFTSTWDDEGPESEVRVTITFSQQNGKTAMTFRKGPFASTNGYDGEEAGWHACFDRLAAYLARTEPR